jgi:hypothetical protein
MCVMLKIDFWVPYQILECPAEFPESLQNKIWFWIRDFREIIL